jgi:hypothetical protein
MKLTVSKDIAGLRAAAIRRVYAAAGLVRTRFATNIPGQEMIYLEKAAEARRFLAAYPTPEDAPAAISADPESGFPFIAADGIDVAVLEIPGPFTATVDGVAHAVTDRLEIASDMPATYRVEVENFPWLPLDVEIVAE